MADAEYVAGHVELYSEFALMTYKAGPDLRDYSLYSYFVGPPAADGCRCGEGERADVSRWSESSWWRTEPDVGRVAHGVPARVDRLRALGNTVVPQVAERAFRVLARELLT